MSRACTCAEVAVQRMQPPEHQWSEFSRRLEPSRYLQQHVHGKHHVVAAARGQLLCNCCVLGLDRSARWPFFIVTTRLLVGSTCAWRMQVQSYLEAIRASRGIYMFRWGDAPIHTFVRKRVHKGLHMNQSLFSKQQREGNHC